MPFRLIRFPDALLLALFLAAACSPGAPTTAPRAAAPGAFPFRSATFTSVLRWEGGQSLSSRYWISPMGVLKEVTDQGKVYFLLRRGGKSYRWDTGAREGTSSVSSGGSRMTGEPDTLDVLRILPEALKPGNFEFSGYEKIEGAHTPVYSFHFRDEKSHVGWKGILWLLPDRAFPVRYVNLDFGGHYEIVNTRIVFDPAIPPEYFEPPPDVRFKSVDIRLK